MNKQTNIQVLWRQDQQNNKSQGNVGQSNKGTPAGCIVGVFAQSEEWWIDVGGRLVPEPLMVLASVVVAAAAAAVVAVVVVVVVAVVVVAVVVVVVVAVVVVVVVVAVVVVVVVGVVLASPSPFSGSQGIAVPSIQPWGWAHHNPLASYMRVFA